MRASVVLVVAHLAAVGCGDKTDEPASTGRPGSAPTGSGGISGVSCNGCLAGDDCVELDNQTNATCGRAGEACVTCPEGQRCNPYGVCMDASQFCGPQNCAGCCRDELVCVESDATGWEACGVGGEACGMCEFAHACTPNGVCDDTLDDNAELYLYVESFEVEPDNGGVAWDPDGMPDPYVCFGVNAISECTDRCTDSLSCVLSNERPVPARGSALLAGDLSFTVWDEDGDVDENIGTSPGVSVERLEDSYQVAPFGNVRQVTFSIRQLPN